MYQKFLKNGELQDEQIIKALQTAAKWYENGELLETRDLLLEIAVAIDEFESSYDELFSKFRNNFEKPLDVF